VSSGLWFLVAFVALWPLVVVAVWLLLQASKTFVLDPLSDGGVGRLAVCAVIGGVVFWFGLAEALRQSSHPDAVTRWLSRNLVLNGTPVSVTAESFIDVTFVVSIVLFAVLCVVYFTLRGLRAVSRWRRSRHASRSGDPDDDS
jgi:hypothetical protein